MSPSFYNVFYWRDLHVCMYVYGADTLHQPPVTSMCAGVWVDHSYLSLVL